MKKNPAILLAAMAVVLTGSEVFGQIQQTAHCNSCQGNCIGYQSTGWNQCHSCQGGVGHLFSGGSCNQGNCGRGISSCWTDCRCFNNSCLGQCCATKAYPDAGWAPPARMPVNYDGVWYGSYLPQAWYGSPGGGFIANYPTVYQPTDTTQMGYYYHKVPTWQSRPGMIPPAPRPADFHTRACPNGLYGHHHGYYSANGASGSCQSCQQGTAAVMSGPQYTSPDGQYTVRRAPQQKEGLLGGFRLTSLTDLWD